jgi:hypothetical protein
MDGARRGPYRGGYHVAIDLGHEASRTCCGHGWLTLTERVPRVLVLLLVATFRWRLSEAALPSGAEYSWVDVGWRLRGSVGCFLERLAGRRWTLLNPSWVEKILSVASSRAALETEKDVAELMRRDPKTCELVSGRIESHGGGVERGAREAKLEKLMAKAM